jgi:acetyl-CoA carboxylase carboxyl transferase subunit alpha
VISPEGCASILWRDSDKAADAAEALKLTSQDLLKLGVIDQVVSEPLGGAHRDPQAIMTRTGDAIEKQLDELSKIPGGELRTRRRQKFIDMGTKGL